MEFNWVVLNYEHKISLSIWSFVNMYYKWPNEREIFGGAIAGLSAGAPSRKRFARGLSPPAINIFSIFDFKFFKKYFFLIKKKYFFKKNSKSKIKKKYFLFKKYFFLPRKYLENLFSGFLIFFETKKIKKIFDSDFFLKKIFV